MRVIVDHNLCEGNGRCVEVASGIFELREDDLGFRNLEDYLSAYRHVLDYFDATRIALKPTPALHTREIFGPAVFHYRYRQAVIDG